ncbi:MAG: hypothetical protein LBQ61_02190 [Spirochaetales bacterium]|jgi:hypothetical protein|nr:hypothetical protein [Spirochaetales bacterium]
MDQQSLLNDRRIRIFSGHFGSGKTEVAVNYVLRLKELFSRSLVGIADLDVVNPYFRSREKTALFQGRSIRLAATSVEALHGDSPAVSPDLLAFLEDPSWQAVLDSGGDPEGSRVLGRFAGKIREGDYDMFLVVNIRRPQTSRAEAALDLMGRLEKTSRLRVTGFINNSHLLKETRPEDLLAGAELLAEMTKKTGLPVRYTCAVPRIIEKLPTDIGGTLFPLELTMREDWM